MTKRSAVGIAVSLGVLGVPIILLVILVTPAKPAGPNDDSMLPISAGQNASAADETASERADENKSATESIDDLLLRMPTGLGLPPDLIISWAGQLSFSRRQTLVLKSESTLDSLEHLSDVEMFYHPGFVHSSGILILRVPLDGMTGQETAFMVLGNRRVLKLLQELSRMSKGKASELISFRIQENLTQYEETFAQDILGSERLHSAGEVPESGLGFRISDREDGVPTLQGLRLSLLSLVYIAGAMHLGEGAHEAIKVVLDESLAQREMFYGHKERGLNEALAVDALATASLYNRQILAVALAGTSKSEAEARQLVVSGLPEEYKPYADEAGYREMRVPAYDAFTTPFELPSMPDRQGSPSYIPPDFSKGEMLAPFYSFVNDDTFDRLVAEWRDN